MARERGVTLIEVMLALMVLSIGALALVRLTVSGAQGTGVSTHMTHATILARSKLDELVRLPSTDAAISEGDHTEPGDKNLGPTGTPYKPNGDPTGNFGDQDGWYARTWTVVDQDLNSTTVGNDYRSIVVTVTWYDGTAKRWRQVAVAGGRSLP